MAVRGLICIDPCLLVKSRILINRTCHPSNNNVSRHFCIFTLSEIMVDELVETRHIAGINAGLSRVNALVFDKVNKYDG